MIKNAAFIILKFIDRFHWLWLLLAAPFLVLPSPVRSLALLVVPVLWILGLWEKRIQNIKLKIGNGKHKIENRKLKIENSANSSAIFVFNAGFPVTPINISLLVLTLMVLVSLWATYSIEQSLEKISGLVLGLGVFFAVVRESKKPWGWPLSLMAFVGGGLGWATLGFLGMNYPVRFSFLAAIISRIPVIFQDLPGAEFGLQHNAVGGTILWYLPLYCVLSVYLSKYKIENIKYKIEKRVSGKTWVRFTQSRVAVWVSRFGLWLGTLFIGGVLVLTQSRGSYLALGVTMLGILFLVMPKRGRWILICLIGLTVIGLGLLLVQTGGWQGFIDQLGLSAEEGLSTRTLDPRLEIWSRAISGVQDFPITGMGMNTFREVVHVLYPFFTISPDQDIAHAHNEFLQAALDLGIPGLIAFISIYGIALWMLIKIWQTPRCEAPSPGSSREALDILPLQEPILVKTLVLGLGGGLFGHLVFGMMDAITLGAKPGIFYWLLLGLITGLYERIEKFKI